MADFSTLKANVANELGLDQTVSGTEDVLLGRRLNDGVRQVLLKTHCYVKDTGSISLSASTSNYQLASDVLAVHNLINADLVPLTHVSVEELLDLRRSNPASSSVWRYAVDGANLLMIYPTPSSSGTLTLYYVPRPTEMSSASHDPSSTTYGGIPVEYHEALEAYALWRLAQYDNQGASQNGSLYRQQFDLLIREARAGIRERGGRKLSPARLRPPYPAARRSSASQDL